jgi:cytochrome b561
MSVLLHSAIVPQPEGYRMAIRVLHWVTVALFLLLGVSGYAMVNLMTPDSAAQEFAYDLHKSFGVTLLAVMMIRIGLRVTQSSPPLPQAIPAFERQLAKLGHLGLYTVAVLTALTGWALTDFGAHGVVWFWLPLPQVFPTTEAIFGIPTDPNTSILHEWLAWGMVALVTIHVAAVVWHRRRHEVNLLRRITLRRR